MRYLVVEGADSSVPVWRPCDDLTDALATAEAALNSGADDVQVYEMSSLPIDVQQFHVVRLSDSGTAAQDDADEVDERRDAPRRPARWDQEPILSSVPDLDTDVEAATEPDPEIETTAEAESLAQSEPLTQIAQPTPTRQTVDAEANAVPVAEDGPRECPAADWIVPAAAALASIAQEDQPAAGSAHAAVASEQPADSENEIAEEPVHAPAKRFAMATSGNSIGSFGR